MTGPHTLFHVARACLAASCMFSPYFLAFGQPLISCMIHYQIHRPRDEGAPTYNDMTRRAHNYMIHIKGSHTYVHGVSGPPSFTYR